MNGPTVSTLTVSDWQRVAHILTRIADEIEARDPETAATYRRDARRIRITVGRAS